MAPPPFRNHRLRPSAVRHGQAAFSLVELLVAVVLGSVVLGALGGALLVSEMRVSTSIRKDLEKKDALNRAMALMRQEISSAGKISINPRNNPGRLCNRTGLDLWRAPNTQICYRPLSINDTRITGAYPSDRPWTGPCVLVREGPPYLAKGELDTAGGPIIQVLVDNLVDCRIPADAMDMRVTNAGLGPVALNSTSRDVDVTINQSGGIATSFSARIASNPLYAGMDMYGDTGCVSGNICFTGTNPGDTSIHFLPRMNPGTNDPISGQADRENVFYFMDARSAYTLAPCTYSGCIVRHFSTSASVVLQNADVLVFADGDFRPGS
jgi:prepilin-type N-terminal cleavage/methylation domain-containing protein